MRLPSLRTFSTIRTGKHAATLLAVTAALAIAPGASAQLIFADSFNVTDGFSPSTGFGSEGVNYQIGSRLSGTAFASNQGMTIRQNTVPAPIRGAIQYSIANNQLQILEGLNSGGFQYSADGGVTGYNFGSFLEGNTYEIKLTMTLGETENNSRRMTFYMTDVASPAGGVAASNYGFQLVSNSTSGGPMSIYERISAAASPTGIAINQSVFTDLAFNTPVQLRLVVTDSTDYGAGVYDSTYQLFVNDSLATTGTFRFNNSSRYLIFDIATNSGPGYYDDFSVTVVPEPSTLALGTLALIVGLCVHRRSRVRAGAVG